MYREIIMKPEKQWKLIVLMAVVFTIVGYIVPRLI